MEMVAELGRPLRDELPAVISASISDAIAPVIAQVGRWDRKAWATWSRICPPAFPMTWAALCRRRAIGWRWLVPGGLEISPYSIRLSHRLAALLDAQTAEVLGLPPVVDLTFRTDVEGALGTPGFRLRHEWARNGQRQMPQRSGAILSTSDGLRRLPLWLMEAVEVAEAFTPGRDEAVLRAEGRLDGLSAIGEEEAIEAIAGPAFVETEEYSARVIGRVVYERPDLDILLGSGTTWLPEVFADPVVQALNALAAPDLEALCDHMRAVIAAGQGQVAIDGNPLPATPEMLRALEIRAETRRGHDAPADANDVDRVLPPEPEAGPGDGGPIILDTTNNFDLVQWRPARRPRMACVPPEPPPGIRTALRPHQAESLSWQIAAWQAGLPGVLNADEQGLGKTLQTIAFLRWLKTHAAEAGAEARGPVLVVAPTSLLQNWEAEVDMHLDAQGFGHLIRLYGAGTRQHAARDNHGTETRTGTPHLDFRLLNEAMADGRGHRFWILTTYTTLTNYQHSLARIPFSAIVFDEIQALKNPASLRAFAARAMQADFRIGLTGTPIENSATDLWAVMDQLAPGALDDLCSFRDRYATPDPANMADLHGRVFHPKGDLPPLALRRLKDTVARDLPTKTRCLHPRLMPAAQAVSYEDARLKLAEGSAGAALKMLHHIRSVSVHPALDQAGSNGDSIAASARLSATFQILHGIRVRRERALVFIEDRQMQFRFIELARQEFGLNRIELINGDTPIQKRQAIVNQFQAHLKQDGGFDLLVLGPKAAGTGLTLTAATHVIHLSRWWNPAVEEQCNDRVHRLGQTRAVTVHVPMAIHPGYRENSFDCLLQSLMTRKRILARNALWPLGDTEEDSSDLRRSLQLGQSHAAGDPVPDAMQAMFSRDHLPFPPRAADGSYGFG